MGMSPKTKAECDRRILAAQKEVNKQQENLASMKAQFGANSPAANNVKIVLQKAKSDLAELKALRKTLK